MNAVIISRTVAFGHSRAQRSAARRSRARMTCMRWSAAVGRELLGSILCLDRGRATLEASLHEHGRFGDATSRVMSDVTRLEADGGLETRLSRPDCRDGGCVEASRGDAAGGIRVNAN